jgi:hypothetical protein
VSLLLDAAMTARWRLGDTRGPLLARFDMLNNA